MRPVLRLVLGEHDVTTRAGLRRHLAAWADVIVLRTCKTGLEVLRAVEELRPNLLILDAQLPRPGGLEIANVLRESLSVVIVARSGSWAVRAFEVNAVDYLTIPVSRERIRLALERARHRIAPDTRMAQPDTATPDPVARIIVRDGPRVHVVPVDELDYVEKLDDYVNLHVRGATYLKQQTLKALAASLDPTHFVQIHRSYLINLDRLEEVQSKDGEPNAVLLHDRTTLPLSRTGLRRLKALL